MLKIKEFDRVTGIRFDNFVELNPKVIALVHKIYFIPSEAQFNGSITLHYSNGVPVKLEKREVERI